MLKRFTLLLAALALSLAAGCSTMPGSATPADPRQQTIDATYTSYKALDAAIVSTTSALRAGVIKTADARKALDAYTTAKAGLDAALASLGAPPPPK